MDVVVHEAVSEKTPTTILGRAPQRSQIRTAVDVVAEDHALVVAARINVEDASLNLFTRPARHLWLSQTETDSAPATLKGV
jgi:hypothetical protein